MENDELIRRFEDLYDRSERSSIVTNTGFLTPAEVYLARNWLKAMPDISYSISGGQDNCERAILFFLPFYMEASELDISEYIHAVKIQAYFEKPAHKDYMGAVLGLGIRREWIGDFRVIDDAAYVFCQPSVESVLMSDLTKVGRAGVKTFAVNLSEVPSAERKVIKKTFTVKSLRLDAVAAEMFNISRTNVAELIRSDALSLNYELCDRVDAAIHEDDILSLHRYGKGVIKQIGGRSRKDRIFVEAELFR